MNKERGRGEIVKTRRGNREGGEREGGRAREGESKSGRERGRKQ